MSILAPESMAGTNANYEQAGIVSLFIVSLTVVVALIARTLGLKVGLHHQ